MRDGGNAKVATRNKRHAGGHGRGVPHHDGDET